MDGFVDFEGFVEYRAVAGLEKLLHDADGIFVVGFRRLDAFDPAPQESFNCVSPGGKKRFADDDRTAGILDRQLTEIDPLVKAELFGFESGIARHDGAVDGADLER